LFFFQRLFGLCVFLLEIVGTLLDFGGRLFIVAGSHLNKNKGVKNDTERGEEEGEVDQKI